MLLTRNIKNKIDISRNYNSILNYLIIIKEAINKNYKEIQNNNWIIIRNSIIEIAEIVPKSNVEINSILISNFFRFLEKVYFFKIRILSVLKVSTFYTENYSWTSF